MSVITTDQCILSGALKLYGSLLNSFPRLGFCLPRAGQGRWKQNLPKLLPAERSSVECEISLGGWWQEEHGQWISPLREPIHWPPGPGGMQQWRGLSPRSWWSCPFRTSWGRLVTWKELVELSPPQIQVPYNTRCLQGLPPPTTGSYGMLGTSFCDAQGITSDPHLKKFLPSRSRALAPCPRAAWRVTSWLEEWHLWGRNHWSMMSQHG